MPNLTVKDFKEALKSLPEDSEVVIVVDAYYHCCDDPNHECTVSVGSIYAQPPSAEVFLWLAAVKGILETRRRVNEYRTQAKSHSFAELRPFRWVHSQAKEKEELVHVLRGIQGQIPAGELLYRM